MLAIAQNQNASKMRLSGRFPLFDYSFSHCDITKERKTRALLYSYQIQFRLVSLKREQNNYKYKSFFPSENDPWN